MREEPAQVEGYGFRPLEHAEEVSIQHFLTHIMDSGSTLRTDGWRGQLDVALFGHTPRIRVVLTPEQAHRVAPHINRVFRNLKTWFNGMHHGVELKYLQSYLDEFVFRFNRRKPQKEVFQTSLWTSIQKAALALTELVNRANCRGINNLF